MSDPRPVTTVQARSVRVGGGTTLFSLAVEHYGDAGEWVRIARANKLHDPWIDAERVLKIPARDGTAATGGVYAP